MVHPTMFEDFPFGLVMRVLCVPIREIPPMVAGTFWMVSVKEVLLFRVMVTVFPNRERGT